MKKVLIATILLTMGISLAGCSAKKDNIEVTEGADGPTAYFEATKIDETEASEDNSTTESSTTEDNSSTEATTTEATTSSRLTDDQALEAVRNYCIVSNPDLEGMTESDDYTIYWVIDSSDDNQVVVLYRSYTAAQVRYYIDRATGETYVTEFVPGITEEEERTDETFNINDYVN
ncbi:hypothetical protein [Butyrivibrio sp. FC2001]|uniref:hypothetical protein n=1 Tax=Butyrivibrio sp. FC2001 TaxID=1280671 RepID=UPI0004134B6D|nr:hypothetical protein [Butyrivibrio sp. FC2001]